MSSTPRDMPDDECLDKKYLQQMYQQINLVQSLIEPGLPNDLIRGDLAKAIKELRDLAVVAAEKGRV